MKNARLNGLDVSLFFDDFMLRVKEQREQRDAQSLMCPFKDLLMPREEGDEEDVVGGGVDVDVVVYLMKMNTK